jgi:hypothetical protein
MTIGPPQLFLANYDRLWSAVDLVDPMADLPYSLGFAEPAFVFTGAGGHEFRATARAAHQHLAKGVCRVLSQALEKYPCHQMPSLIFKFCEASKPLLCSYAKLFLVYHPRFSVWLMYFKDCIIQKQAEQVIDLVGVEVMRVSAYDVADRRAICGIEIVATGGTILFGHLLAPEM